MKKKKNTERYYENTYTDTLLLLLLYTVYLPRLCII